MTTPSQQPGWQPATMGTPTTVPCSQTWWMQQCKPTQCGVFCHRVRLRSKVRGERDWQCQLCSYVVTFSCVIFLYNQGLQTAPGHAAQPYKATAVNSSTQQYPSCRGDAGQAAAVACMSLGSKTPNLYAHMHPICTPHAYMCRTCIHRVVTASRNTALGRGM